MVSNWYSLFVDVQLRKEVSEAHNLLNKHDEELTEILDWIEERKLAFNESRKQSNAKLTLPKTIVSIE